MSKIFDDYNNLPLEIRNICHPVFIKTQITDLLIEKRRLKKAYKLHLRELNSHLKNCEDALSEYEGRSKPYNNIIEGKGKDMSGISNDRKFTKFKIGERVIGENMSGDIVKLTVGGYMDQPPIPFADWKYQFFDKGNEEDGWYDDRNFREMTGIELLEELSEELRFWRGTINITEGEQ